MTDNILKVELELSNGELVTRIWTIKDLTAASPVMKDRLHSPPEFLFDFERNWNHPQDPVTYKAYVEEGNEEAAKAWIESL